MKKTIFLLLALVLCLSLCACGIDSEKAESAMIDHPMLPHMYGRWERIVEDGIKCSFNTIIINEDGTCVIDGIEANWKIDHDNSNYEHKILWVYFFEGSNRLGGVVIDEDLNNDIMFLTLEPEGWLSGARWEKQ